MYNLQIVFISIFLTVFSGSQLFAQLKVKESSEKNKPGWIQKTDQTTIVIKGSGATMEEAQKNALEMVKTTIKKDAVNLILNENIYLKSLELDEQAASDMFEGIDYYANIKHENNKGIYWEYLFNKETKEKYYDYYLNYPYNGSELTTVINDLADSRLSENIDAIQQKFIEFTSIEELITIWKALMYLSPQISDDSQYKIKIEELMAELEASFSKIEIVPFQNIQGFLVVFLVLNERVLDFSTPPTISSNCAKLLSASKSVDKWEVLYSYENCAYSRPYKLTLEFNTGYNKITKDFELNPSKEILDAKISTRDFLILGNNLQFFISSRYRDNLVIERIIIRYNDLHFTDTPMKQVLKGAGLYDITFNLPPDFNQIKVNEKVRGELHYKSQKTGQKGVCYFYNQPIKRSY